jgi:hypothetical protein
MLLATNSFLAQQTNLFGNLPLHYLCADPVLDAGVKGAGSSGACHYSESVRLLLAVYPAGAVHRNKAGESPVERALARWHTRREPELALTLRLLLRSAPAGTLVPAEQQALWDLNWEDRKHALMSIKKCRIDAGDSVESSKDSDLDTFSRIVSMCEQHDNQLLRLIFAYL